MSDANPTGVPEMNERQALAFIRKHGIVLVSARGPVPTLTDAIAGKRIRGSWWGHRDGRHIFTVLSAVRDSPDVLVCRLLNAKLTLVHRRLWPALVRLAGRRFPKRNLAQVREVHTAQGHHRNIVTPFPRWVPGPVLNQAGRLGLEKATAMIGAGWLSTRR